MRDILQRITSGISAGILISIGGCVFLSCDNKYVGAVLFCVALLCICFKGYSLYTGKIGYIAEKCGKEELSVLFLGLLGNALSTCLIGAAMRKALPAVGARAAEICALKLEQTVFSAFLRAVFCGVLMYLAVSIYKDLGRTEGILFCIPVFILSGFEHSVADMFYFAASGIVSLKAFGYIWLIVLGNSVGAMILPLLKKIEREKKKNG